MIYPKYGQVFLANWHFFALTLRPASPSLWRTAERCLRCSSQLSLYTMTSSKYAAEKSSQDLVHKSLESRGSTHKSKWRCGELKFPEWGHKFCPVAVFRSYWDLPVPFVRSRAVMNFAFPSLSINSSILSIG